VEIAHIVNPVLADPSSDLYTAQPITFETMRRARAYAAPHLKINLFSAQFAWDETAAPAGFARTADLTRSVLDVAQFKIPRQLPLLADILDRLYQQSQAEYFIYTNVDIALQPSFYVAVHGYIQDGFDSFVINRRTIDARYATIGELDEMYSDHGIAHRGWDCFIFPSHFCPRFRLYDVCLGASRVGLALLSNLVALSHNFYEFKEEYLTFHIGDEQSWRQREYADYSVHNTVQLMRILSELEEEHGAFPPDSIPGSFLFRKRHFGSLYEAWARNVYLPAGLRQILDRLTGRG
jgi:hypothetical protein